MSWIGRFRTGVAWSAANTSTEDRPEDGGRLEQLLIGKVGRWPQPQNISAGVGIHAACTKAQHERASLRCADGDEPAPSIRSNRNECGNRGIDVERFEVF